MPARRPSLPRSLAPLTAALLLAPVAAMAQSTTAFTYQGRLTESGQPASGLYDLQACLFDEPGNEIACAPDLDEVPVEAGLFTVALDFGSAPFNGQARFLELRVRPGASSGAYTRLNPRQRLRPTPEALRADAASAAPWSGLTGVPAGFADGTDDTGSGTVTSITAGTGLSGGTITGSGTIGIANGGVGPAQIAAGAVGSAQIDPAQVQARINGTCGDGFYVRQVNAAGNVLCGQDANAGGTVTAIATGAGLTGGPINTVGVISIANGGVGLAQINTAQVQARIMGTCAAGSYLRGINSDGSVQCADLPGATTIATVDAAPATVRSTTDLAIDAGGLPVVSYSSAGEVRIARCRNLACTSASLAVLDSDASTIGHFASLAIGPAGRPIVSYVHYNGFTSSVRVASCADPECSGPTTIQVIDPGTSTQLLGTSIAIGLDGRPVIAYHDDVAGSLKVARCLIADCTTGATIAVVDDPANVVGRLPSIAIGVDGRPIISYHDATAGALKVARCADAACNGAATITTLDDDPGSTLGTFSAIAIGGDGAPVIAYSEELPGAGLLWVARCNAADCASAATLQPVDGPDPSVGQYPSIAIGTDSLPIIAYRADGIGGLKVARCGDLSCGGATTVTVIGDPAQATGSGSSIAIGGDGLPVIAFHALGDLRVARCGSRSCR
jgi:hypothetical protein